MKNRWLLIVVAGMIWSCNDQASVKVTVDSSGKRLDSSASEVWDSTKSGLKKAGEKVKEVGERVKNKVEGVDIHIRNGKDSIK